MKKKEKPQPPKKGKSQEAELTESLQRLQAEFENFQKRTEKEKMQMAEYGKAQIVLKLLPVLDSFDLALHGSADSEKFKHGVQLIAQELKKVLAQEGLKEIPAEGTLNPELHEVVLTERAETEDTILQVLQKGYTLHNHVIRPSKVKVGVKKS